MIKTSTSHPLRIDELSLPGTTGLLGLTFCPGKRQPRAASGAWERELGADLRAIAAWGAVAIVNLVEEHEMRELGVEDTAQRLPEAIDYYQLPIPDAGIPDADWERAWQQVGPALRGNIAAGGRVLVHCKGGLGRTGLLAARILVEFGMTPAEAVARVRAARHGSIETQEQLDYVMRLRG